MTLPVFWSVFLIVAAAWSLVVWPQFFKRVRNDPLARDADGRATTFLTVHVVLVTVSLVLAVGVAVVGIGSLV